MGWGDLTNRALTTINEYGITWAQFPHLIMWGMSGQTALNSIASGNIFWGFSVTGHMDGQQSTGSNAFSIQDNAGTSNSGRTSYPWYALVNYFPAGAGATDREIGVYHNVLDYQQQSSGRYGRYKAIERDLSYYIFQNAVACPFPYKFGTVPLTGATTNDVYIPTGGFTPTHLVCWTNGYDPWLATNYNGVDVLWGMGCADYTNNESFSCSVWDDDGLATINCGQFSFNNKSGTDKLLNLNWLHNDWLVLGDATQRDKTAIALNVVTETFSSQPVGMLSYMMFENPNMKAGSFRCGAAATSGEAITGTGAANALKITTNGKPYYIMFWGTAAQSQDDSESDISNIQLGMGFRTPTEQYDMSCSQDDGDSVSDTYRSMYTTGGRCYRQLDYTGATDDGSLSCTIQNDGFTVQMEESFNGRVGYLAFVDPPADIILPQQQSILCP